MTVTMDPNANLDRQRRILAALRELTEKIEQDQEGGGDRGEAHREAQDVLLAELSEHAEAMDEWLSRGRSLPSAWARDRSHK